MRSCAVVLVCVLAVLAQEGAGGEEPSRSLLGPPADIRIEVGVELARGVAGFAIDAPPFDSRLEYPVSGYHYHVSFEVAPLPSLPDLAFIAEASVQPEVFGSTKDTDWVRSTKWLYSRSETEGTVFRIEGLLSWRLVRAALLDLDLRGGGFYGRDIFIMSQLRQVNLLPELTSPTSESYVTVSGEVARYEQRIAGLSLGLQARVALGRWFDLHLGGTVLPFAWVEGYGNWKLRHYRFQQYGPSFFLSYALGAEISLRLAPWLRVTAGVRRLDWRAEDIGEDGQFAEDPGANYENIGVVAYVRHVQYGFTLALSARL